MKKCICKNHGYCEYYKQEMTFNPPNWQWCQSATEDQRIKYKMDCQKKHERRQSYLAGEYVTTARMIEDCKNLLLPQVYGLNLKGILGVPRSGMLPASMLAMWLNIPLYYLDEENNLKILTGATEFGGVRMRDHKSIDGKLLVVDDTIYAGRAMNLIKERLPDDILFATIYLRPEAESRPDFFARELPSPHLLEWNLFNCTYIEQAILDFDGIFSPNVPIPVCEDEPKYIEFIKNVKPFPHRIPKTHCMGIATGRLEKYRDITEKWLEDNGISYGFLKMFPTEREEERNRNHAEEVSTFKAKIFSESDAKFFIESEVPEAVKIRQKSGKLVICPDERLL